MRCGWLGRTEDDVEQDMHHFLVDVAALRNTHRHARDDVVLEPLGLDALHVLHDTLVRSVATALVGDLGTTIDRAQNRVHLHEVVVLHGLQERGVGLPMSATHRHDLKAETSVREHVHDLVDCTILQQRFSSVEANRQIVDLPILNAPYSCVLEGFQLGEVVGHLLWMRIALVLVDLAVIFVHFPHGDILDILIVLVRTAVRAGEVTTLAVSPLLSLHLRQRDENQHFTVQCLRTSNSVSVSLPAPNDSAAKGGCNKQEIEIVLSIQSKYGLFLLIVLLRITEVSKELRVNLRVTSGEMRLLPSCNEHAGAEAS